MNDPSSKLSGDVWARLSIMMFLQFFIWSAWFVTLATYLSQSLKLPGDSIGYIYSTFPWAAIVTPFFIGMIADRYFSAQKVLGVLHLVGAMTLFLAAWSTNSTILFWIMMVYAICYNPTLALMNAISFHQMQHPEKQFPSIRMFGAIGWIAAGLTVGLLKIEATAIPLKIAAVASIILGLFSFILPHTPPKSLGHKVTIRDILCLDALKLMKDRSFAIFIFCTLLTCIPLSFYFTFADLFLNEKGIQHAAAKMTMGQLAEVFCMLAMPFFFARLGVKKMMLSAMLAWLVRYLLFAFGNPGGLVWMYYGGILLHGLCYDFFFVTGMIYVNKTASKTIKASAQGFFAFITYGVGMLVGAQIAGRVLKHYQDLAARGATSDLWRSLWLVPAATAFVTIILLALLFKTQEHPTVLQIHVDEN